MEKAHTNSEILIYQNLHGDIKIDVRLEDETVWLTQAQMAELFGKSRSTITEHIQNVFKEGELEEHVVCRNFRHTTQHGAIEGKTQEVEVKHYNLDVIISVGYRVKSPQGTQFRIWATQRLKEYIIKGFTLNDERFKSGNSMNYFTELQERIREIRLSERFFYQKIKDIYTTSIDYDPKDENTIAFFKVVQNKLLWAISRQKEAITKTMNSLFASVNSSNFKNRKQLAHENNERSCKSIINTFDLLLHTYTKRFFCINTFTKLPIS